MYESNISLIRLILIMRNPDYPFYTCGNKTINLICEYLQERIHNCRLFLWHLHLNLNRAGSRIFRRGGVDPFWGDFGLQHGHLSVKMYAKMRVLGPVGGGGCAGTPP